MVFWCSIDGFWCEVLMLVMLVLILWLKVFWGSSGWCSILVVIFRVGSRVLCLVFRKMVVFWL